MKKFIYRKKIMKSVISALSHYEPKKIVTNEDIAKLHIGSKNKEGKIYTEDDITAKALRAGIHERKWADQSENAATMAIEVVKNMQEEYGKEIFDNLHSIIVGTFTGPYFYPGISYHVAEYLGHSGATNDINNACVGFITGLHQSALLQKSGSRGKTLIIGTDVMSRAIDFKNPKTGVLFGDAAGAVLLDYVKSNFGVQGGVSASFPNHLLSAHQKSPFYGSETMDTTIQLNGPDVYKFGVKYVVEVIMDYIKKNNLDISMFDYLVPHQANANMIDEISQKIGIDDKKVIKNVHINGNTAAASIPLALSQHKNSFSPGDRILMVSLGSGLAIGLVDIIWGS